MDIDILIAYLQTTWAYFPYLFFSFVLLTFLPKSLSNIKAFADADYEENRHKYHRCYGPDTCCHTLLGQTLSKPKQRKAVTRVYPKRQTPSTDQDAPSIIKRPAAASILSANHVNEMAKMFESGATSKSRQINRVPPTISPEVRMSRNFGFASDDQMTCNSNNNSNSKINKINKINNNKSNNISSSYSNGISKKYSAPKMEENLENIENAANVLNHVAPAELDANWRSEPIVVPRQQRQQRPSTLSFSDGTSATPSSGSPTTWVESSPTRSMDEDSPSLRRMSLNLKASLEDIFAAIARNAESNIGSECGLKFAGCNSLSPVTSIDDILSQRRLSRPLSAYSISDLLNEESNESSVDGVFVETVLRSLNKT